LEDRLVVGGIAGLIGAAVQNAYSYIIVGLNLARYTYSDFATTVLTNRLYSDPLGLLAGFIAYLSVGVILGVLFAYLVAATGSEYLYIKGLIYGFILWFLLTGFGTVFGLPTFIGLAPISAVSILLGGLLFGVVTAYVIKIFEHKTELL
jgi:hypothetical protein